MTRKDIAIIGGTFDPVHNGHIQMAKYLSDNYIVDEVWMLPSYNSPHKEVDTISSFDHRVNMLNIALSDTKNIIVSLYEKEYYESNNGNVKTYTYEILESLKKKYLNIRIHFVVGFDSIKDISKWHEYKKLIENYWFYIFNRKDNEFKTKEQKINYLQNLGVNFGHKCIYELFDYEVEDISSTELRYMLKDINANRNKLEKYLNLQVLKYIENNKLYL